MKRLFYITALLCCICLISGCAKQKEIDGITYDTYGLFNMDDNKNPNIQYRLVVGNVVWGIILAESIVFPIYFFGFSLYEPVCKKEAYVKGKVK